MGRREKKRSSPINSEAREHKQRIHPNSTKKIIGSASIPSAAQMYDQLAASGQQAKEEKKQSYQQRSKGAGVEDSPKQKLEEQDEESGDCTFTICGGCEVSGDV